MKLARNLLAVLGSLLLVIGYGASQLAHWQGPESAYAWHLERADTFQFQILSLFLLLGAVVCAVIPVAEEAES